LHQRQLLTEWSRSNAAAPPSGTSADSDIQATQLNEVIGQHHAKRALEIAASGGHNLLFYGPPGTGKTMLASRLPGILPPLTNQQALEVVFRRRQRSAAIRLVAPLSRTAPHRLSRRTSRRGKLAAARRNLPRPRRRFVSR